MAKDYSDLIKKADLTKLKPYGDIMNDGVVQLSFTLPVAASPEAREAAIQLTQKMGFDEIKVSTVEAIAEGFSFFVIYAKLKHTIDFTKIKVVKVDAPKHSMSEINSLIQKKKVSQA